jgi:hypothetical protein
MICILTKHHLSDQIKKNEMDRARSMYRGQKCACRVLVGKPEGKRPLVRPMHRWVKQGKAVPLQAWSGPEGSRKLRFPDFMTMAQDSDKVVSLMHRLPLPPGNTPGTHFC